MFGDDMFSCSSDFSTSPFDHSMSDSLSDFNPANGLLMIGCVDIKGNLWGCDSMNSASSFGSLFGW